MFQPFLVLDMILGDSDIHPYALGSLEYRGQSPE